MNEFGIAASIALLLWTGPGKFLLCMLLSLVVVKMVISPLLINSTLLSILTDSIWNIKDWIAISIFLPLLLLVIAPWIYFFDLFPLISEFIMDSWEEHSNMIENQIEQIKNDVEE